MPRFIESLEGRTLFSAANPLFHADAPMVHAAVHAPNVKATQLQFTGYATDTNGKQTAITVTVAYNADGTGSGLAVHTNSDGTFDRYTFKIDKTGHFAFGYNEQSGTLSVQGQVSTDRKSVTGTFASTHVEQGETYSDAGTFFLTLPANPSPTPSPKTLTTGTHYVGTNTDSDGTTGTVTLDIFKTTNGMTFGTVTHRNAKGVVDATFTVKFDANGHFLYTGSDTGGQKTGGIDIEGQLSTDKTTIVGNYTVTKADGAVTGTFVLKVS